MIEIFKIIAEKEHENMGKEGKIVIISKRIAYMMHVLAITGQRCRVIRQRKNTPENFGPNTSDNVIFVPV